ncbi:helix-turn-helix domain-containing protein [Nocardiopsis algeriensis]|uniref:Transcriptional regulator with XRE-family HTH domain n=1 Tax=Nocardiopsis algeriensis TaxID=1478215 RepID=A0A841ITH9_9ACTN|nr:helix-turn-helix transcriptional regulator [Nocardiopsis algeriensis]MBB6120556.1 transcriptional regulator with XRE-family HTH domain [Nocardiopsis algeriensis]
MTPPNSPTLRLRRLATMLRQARESAGYTATQVGNQLKWSSGKVSKMETTETKRIKADDLDKLMDLYGIIDRDKRAAMQALAKDARQRGWWSKYKEVFTERALPDFEAEASVIRTFETQMIPGLLQTPAYAEALLRGGRFTDSEILRKKAEARMARREILVRHNPARFRAIIEENALRREIGSKEILKAQLGHLHHMAQMPNIDVQVLPANAGSHAGLCAPFTVLEFPDPLDLPIVYIDTASNGLFLEEQDEVEAHSVTFSDIQGSALSTVQSADLITSIMKSLESPHDHRP